MPVKKMKISKIPIVGVERIIICDLVPTYVLHVYIQVLFHQPWCESWLYM